MYEEFFGCRERPFDLSPNPRYLVPTSAHREALSTLEYGIASRKGIVLLLGEAGTGKTTVIRAALERQPSRVHYVHMHNPALTRDEFIEMLAMRFHLSDRARTSKTTLLLELEDLLRSRQELGETTLLVIDEAQSLPEELLEEIRLLANIETESAKLISVVMAGQPELAARLNQSGLRQFKQRIALRCELRPLTAQEAFLYIAGRMRAAGCANQVFTREAVVAMHEYARGIPRLVSVIADNALLTAFALGERLVTVRIVTEVCGEFDIEASAARAGTTAVPVVEKLAQVESSGAFPRERSQNRLLAMEDARQRPAPAPTPAAAPSAEPPVARTPNPPQAPAHVERGLFSGLLPKRRRFSFFS
jgi:type II secretory pathway predicted ATPase ExeA